MVTIVFETMVKFVVTIGLLLCCSKTIVMVVTVNLLQQS